MKKFAELLERLRKAQQITKRDLANRANLTPGYISLLTRGERQAPSEVTVKALADALNLHAESRAHFFEAAGYVMHTQQPITSDAASLLLQNGQSEQKEYFLIDDEEEIPNEPFFSGREGELKLLEQWIMEGCQLVTILGPGGIGKTTLAAKLVSQVRKTFKRVIWHSLQSAPRLEMLLKRSVLPNGLELPRSEEEQIAVLLHYLRTHRCLLVLDNFESVLRAGKSAGRYSQEYKDYGKLLQRLGETQHQSCVLLTSREQPREVLRLEKTFPTVRSLKLSGVTEQEAREILKNEGLSGVGEDWHKFIQYYAGNPLALKLIAASIRELFGGDIAWFLREGEYVFGELYDAFNQQFSRLSEQERNIMYWLAIEGEPVSLNDLGENILPPISKRELQEAVDSLRRRSMIEGKAGRFTLHPAIMEYIIDRLVRAVCKEIDAQTWLLLDSHALMQGQAEDYIRTAQINLIVKPVTTYLCTTYGKEGAEQRLKEMLAKLHAESSQFSGYRAKNLLYLLIQLPADLSGLDFSHLPMQQAYLQGIELPQVKFAGADLVNSIFTDCFGPVHSVALSPDQDGVLLAAGTANGEVRLWKKTISDTPFPPYVSFATYRGHTHWVRSVNFSNDGKYLASASDDHTIRLWEVNTGEPQQNPLEHRGRVYSVVFCPNDNTTLVSGCQDGSLYVWEMKTGKCLRTLPGHSDRIWSVAISPDGRTLASGSEDQTIRLWDRETGHCLHVLRDHTAPVWSVAFSPDGKTLASGSEDQTIRLWDRETGKCFKVLKGHKRWIRAVIFSLDGQKLISASDDCTIRLWKLRTDEPPEVLEGHTNWVRSVAVSHGGQLLVSGSEDHTVRMWNIRTGKSLRTLQGYNTCIYAVAFSPDGRFLASSDKEGLIYLWEVDTGEHTGLLWGHSNSVQSVAFSPKMNYLLASCSEDHQICLWEIRKGGPFPRDKPRKVLKDHADWIYTVAFSNDGQLLASGSEDKTIRLWEVRTGRCLRILPGHTDWILAVAFSPVEPLLVSGSEDGTVRLWRVDTDECTTLEGPIEGGVYSVSFSPDGKWLACGGDDRRIHLWNVLTRQYLGSLDSHDHRVRAVVFCTDSILISGSEDQTIRFWNVETGQLIETLRTRHRIFSIAYSNEKKVLALGSYDGTIELWNVTDYKKIRSLRSQRPYEGMDITDTIGLMPAQKATLKALGASEYANID